ncbi:MAG: hypothetical protein ABI467_12445 [Kofleriaceae bacterium]
MSSRSDVLLWARRITGMKKTPPHQLLEIEPDAGLDAAQEAFHKIARMAHPDLHRTGLDPDDLELVTSAYAIIANAYQSFRSHAMTTQRMPRLDPDDSAPAQGNAVPATPSGTPPVTTGVAGAMSSKALTYYRKAELCLKRGDLRGAMLQLKMAIGTDPGSTFLRTALHEVENEVRKGP